MQDNWSITSKLSLNLGVRYDVESGVKNTDFANPVETGDRSSDADNIAPRVGFAYDVRGNGRTVVRGGYGRYYDKVLLNITTNERRQVTGQFIAVTVQSPTKPDRSAGRADVRGLQEPEPSAQHHRAGQRLRDAAAGRSGVDRHGAADRHALRLPGGLRAHERRERTAAARGQSVRGSGYAPAAQSGAVRASVSRSDVRITRYETSAKSKYDGLQLGFTGRSTAKRIGYQYQGSYILSKTYDDHTGNRFSAVSNPFNLADEYTRMRARISVTGSSRTCW